jgi:hypothetical protein
VPIACAPGSALSSTDTTCDNVDDDCSGLADEDVVGDTTCGVGYCRTHNTPGGCVGGTPTACVAGTPLSSSDSTCDDVDDDCDGTADEDWASDASCGVGYCHDHNTPSTCIAGQFFACTPSAPLAATDATCDGVDDDCNGTADEDYLVDASCGLGYCRAHNTPSSCTAGIETVCQPASPLAADDTTCDGQNDDCDTFTDEDALLGDSCAGASSVCQVATCDTTVGGCVTTPISGCCEDDQDCQSSQCIDATCDLTSHRCVPSFTPRCCATDADCDEGNPCTVERCDTGSGTCSRTDNDRCCQSNADCDDNDVCSIDVCTADHACLYRPGACDVTPCGGDPNCTFSFLWLDRGDDAAKPPVVYLRTEPVMQLRVQNGALAGTLDALEFWLDTNALARSGLPTLVAGLYVDQDDDGEVDLGSTPIALADVTLPQGVVRFDGLSTALQPGTSTTLLVTLAQPNAALELTSCNAERPSRGGVFFLLFLVAYTGVRRQRWRWLLLALALTAALALPGCWRGGFQAAASAVLTLADAQQIELSTTPGQEIVVSGLPLSSAPFDIVLR